MPLNFRKLGAPKSTTRPTDPIALFQSLRVTDTAINDLWLAQGDALREWDKQRTAGDVAIVLNTGAGKTLVGLLAAQSLVIETGGHVVYACSSLQLVHQTASKARGYGLDVTTYVSGQFSNDLYRQGLAPCITTYQALFNGRSRFFEEDLSAVIFDDAHTSGHLLRDQFTLRVERDAFGKTFAQLVQLFRPYFTRIGKELGYTETQGQRDAATVWFVPPFVVKEQLAELQRIMLEASFTKQVSTMFAWEYLRDHLDLCAVVVSGTEVSFTPAVVPVRTLPYFRDGVRRLYLSATLVAGDGFLRAFGRVPDTVIAPSTTAGECERLILIPALLEHQGKRPNDVEIAQRIIAGHKSLVLVPTRRRAQAWNALATKYEESVAEQVEQFKTAGAPACLVLTARYDGVDLPGDTCRVLVIDELPTGVNPLERYLWEHLGLLKLLRSTVASRVVQSFGRISRGMGDHGVVVLTGRKLVDWILSPKNQALLPEFLQRQLQLGIYITRNGTEQDLVDAAQQCLSRDEDWTTYYQRSMDDLEAKAEAAIDAAEVLRITKAELDFGHALWARDYVEAAKVLNRELEATFVASRAMGGWHALWLGYCYELMGDAARAHELYERAHRAERNIPPLAVRVEVQEHERYSAQVLAVTELLLRGGQVQSELPPHFDTDLSALDGTGTVPQTEAALEALGIYLGLEARRPDNEVGTGPDVLWTVPGGPALSVEAKTAKEEQTVYRKKELGQLRDHRQWVRDELGAIDVYSAFVGAVAPASADSNPDPDMVVVELGELRALRDRLRAALLDVCSTAVPLTTAMTVREVFHQRGLIWPAVYEQLPKHILQDIARRT